MCVDLTSSKCNYTIIIINHKSPSELIFLLARALFTFIGAMFAKQYAFIHSFPAYISNNVMLYTHHALQIIARKIITSVLLPDNVLFGCRVFPIIQRVGVEKEYVVGIIEGGKAFVVFLLAICCMCALLKLHHINVIYMLFVDHIYI